MTKQELVERVHVEAGDGLSRKATAEVIDAMFKSIIDGLNNSDPKKFFYPGFGTFQVKDRKARVGRNPRTGDPIQIPASRTVTFKPAAALKASL